MSASASLLPLTVWRQWEAKFALLPLLMADATEEILSEATEAMYDTSQEVVHVITGYLKSTGHWEVERDGMEIAGTVEYDAEYAVYENARGGDHAFMDIAYERTAPMFESMLTDAWNEVWR